MRTRKRVRYDGTAGKTAETDMKRTTRLSKQTGEIATFALYDGGITNGTNTSCVASSLQEPLHIQERTHRGLCPFEIIVNRRD